MPFCSTEISHVNIWLTVWVEKRWACSYTEAEKEGNKLHFLYALLLVRINNYNTTKKCAVVLNCAYKLEHGTTGVGLPTNYFVSNICLSVTTILQQHTRMMVAQTTVVILAQGRSAKHIVAS